MYTYKGTYSVKPKNVFAPIQLKTIGYLGTIFVQVLQIKVLIAFTKYLASLYILGQGNHTSFMKKSPKLIFCQQ
jgi:hypothetical protein